MSLLGGAAAGAAIAGVVLLLGVQGAAGVAITLAVLAIAVGLVDYVRTHG